MRRRQVALLAAAATGLLLVGGCTDEDDADEAMAVGDVVVGSLEVPGRLVHVETPEGRVDFIVSDPLDEAPVFDGPDSAPEDGSLVAVGWEWNFLSAFAAMDPGSDDPVEPDVRLVVDGREYSLDEAILREDRRPDEPVLKFSGTAYVAVDGTPDELGIALEYDGLDQVVEVGDPAVVREGPAAALYRQPDELARHDLDCGAPRTPGRGVLPDTIGQCRLSVARVPYEPTSGWVDGAEMRWLVVDARVWPEHFPDVGRGFCGAGVLGPVRYRLEGARPAKETLADPDDPNAGDRLVFDTDQFGPETLRMTAVQSFPDGGDGCGPLRLAWEARI